MPAGAASSTAIPVKVARVELRDVPDIVKAPGNVEAYSTVSLRAQVAGRVTQVSFGEGDAVKEGDLLFSLDPGPFEAALREAQASLARDSAEARNAQAELRRVESLLKADISSQDEYDVALTKMQALEATVKADEAAAESTRIKLQYTKLRSPTTGRVGEILVHAGNVVKENETVLAIVRKIDPISVRFAVPERYLEEIRKRRTDGPLRVNARIPGDDEVLATGELSFVDPAVNETAGTVLLKGLFANPEEKLWPGQYVETVLTLSVQRGQVVAPARAIERGQAGDFTFVVRPDQTVETRSVLVTKRMHGDAVVQSGLREGELVVVDGQIRLAPGSRVEVQNPPAPERAGGAGGGPAAAPSPTAGASGGAQPGS